MSDYLRFAPQNLDPGLIVYGAYEPWLVILSILVAVFTSSVALETARHMRKARSKRIRNTMLLVGSFAMGGGVWAMHFIGMLAFKLCGGIAYGPLITLLSMIPSVFASAVALHLLSQEQIGVRRMLEGGVLIGLGIGSMHYTGMAAMRISSALYYDPMLFSLSIVVAVVLSVLGVWIRFGLQNRLPGLTASQTTLAGGSVLGCAIAGMHYTGMAAAVFIGNPAQCPAPGLGDISFLAIAIASVTVLIALLSLGLTVTIRQKDLASHLLTERRRQHAIINTAVDGIILIDISGSILEFNPACEKLFGYRRDEVLGRNIKMLMPEPFHSEHDDYLQHYRETGEKKIIGTTGREGEGQRKDGSVFPVDLSIGEFVDASEQLYIGVIRDISGRKRMENDLRCAKELAERAAAAKTVFLANMSHEIRTPMNAIIGFVELVLSQPLGDTQRKHLSTAHNSARSLLRLLNDILDTAKLDEAAVELEKRPFSLDVLLDELYSTFAISAQEKDLVLRVKRDPVIHACYVGDATRLRQVLSNLIGNAVKFTEQGRVDLTVSASDGTLRFDVEDTGIGIAADKLETIFQPFLQSDASMTRRFGGTGLGTTIAKQLVELMGGEITVSSTEGQGSCFSFTLRLVPADCPAESDAQTMAVPKMAHPLRILIAEDVPANAELMTIRLESSGNEVTVVTHGEQAVEASERQVFDLILMDIHMPAMDGLEATRRIRQRERNERQPHTPIIALTAGAFQQDRDAAAAAGMDGFVTKPVELESLYREIRRVLGDKAFRVAETTLSGDEHHDFPVLPGIDTRRALATWGDADSYRQQLQRFSDDFSGYYLELREQLQAGNDGAAIDLAHRLKGAAANLHIQRVARAADRIETQLRHGEETDLALSDLFTALSNAVNAISGLQAAGQGPLDTSRPDADCERVTTLYPQLLASLAQGDFDESLIDQLRAALGNTALNDAFKSFEKAVNDFDPDIASDCLTRLVNTCCSGEDNG